MRPYLVQVPKGIDRIWSSPTRATEEHSDQPSSVLHYGGERGLSWRDRKAGLPSTNIMGIRIPLD